MTGTLRFTGNFRWNGVILAVGDGEMEYGGGGNPEINGTVFAAKIWDDYTTKNLLPTLGSPRSTGTAAAATAFTTIIAGSRT